MLDADSRSTPITCQISIDWEGHATPSKPTIDVKKGTGPTKIIWEIVTPGYAFGVNVNVLLPISDQFSNGRLDPQNATKCSVKDANSDDKSYAYAIVVTAANGLRVRHDPLIKNGR